jgi:hypothetical protein
MKSKTIIISLMFLLALFGCVPRVTVQKAPPGISLASLGEGVLIFGRIRWIQNGEERHSFSGLYGDFNVDLRVLNVEDMKVSSIFEIEKDGRFFALLPKGTYIIHRLDWAEFWGRGSLVPRVALQIAKPKYSYYLGTLTVNVTTKRNIFGDYFVKGLDIYIEDEEEEAMEIFRKRYPYQELNIVKALMVHDPSIPRLDELERGRKLAEVLQALQFGIMPMTYP